MDNVTSPVSSNSFSLMHFWQQGDVISHAVVFILLIMAVISWVTIVFKTTQLANATLLPVALERFWRATDIGWGSSELKRHKAALNMIEASAVVTEAQGHYSLSMQGSKSHAYTRAIRHCMTQEIRRLEYGLTVLASIGAVAPFVGLFGTVWGIFHALLAMSSAGSASLANISGPVGESLIMTAAGLFVAIPAVLAYNYFSRAVRNVAQELNGFAFDLQAYLQDAPYTFIAKKAA